MKNYSVSSALKKTFPNYLIKIIKKNNQNNQGKNGSVNICDGDGDCDDDDNILYYSNPIFSLEITNEKLILKTKYLSPCMFVINELYTRYNKIGDFYHIEILNLNLPDLNSSNKFVLEQNKFNEFDEFDEFDEIVFTSNELVFNPNNMIPIEYISMVIDFYDTETNNCIEKIIIESEQNPNPIPNEQFKLFISTLNASDDIIKNSYNDYSLNLNLNLRILDPEWIILDTRFKLPNGKNYSNIVEKFFNWVFESKLKTLSNFNCTIDKIFFVEPNKIKTISKAEGGIDLSSIFLSFGYSELVNKKQSHFYLNFIRCGCNCYECINSFNINLNETYHSNRYYGSNSDLLCLVVFNEMLKKFGMITELEINDKIYSNKSNTIGSELYYQFYGYYNKHIE